MRTSMIGVGWLLLVLLTIVGPAPLAAQTPGAETVVLLHGLGRTSRSMRPLVGPLERAGYRVVNLGYPSRTRTVEELLPYLRDELEACCAGVERVHFVTHSLGGILVRAYAKEHDAPRVGRVVMLSPPNRGSALVDHARRIPVLGPLLLYDAGPQLGTDSASVPLALGPVEFELGVITGDRSWNPLYSSWIPGPDDGKVGIERAKVEGMDDFLVVHRTHTFIMNDDEVARQVVRFLETGAFEGSARRAFPVAGG